MAIDCGVLGSDFHHFEIIAMASISKKKRRGRKPNAMKYLYDLIPEQPRKRGALRNSIYKKKIKYTSLSSRRKNKGHYTVRIVVIKLITIVRT